MGETYVRRHHEVNWTLRSLMAAGLISICFVATALSVTVSAERAAAERAVAEDRAREAQLVESFVNYLAAETVEARLAYDAPRLKPAVDVSTTLADDDPIASFVEFDLAALAAAKIDGKALKCLAQAIYYEARSEARIGQAAVADVVLNRVASPLYPNSICGVVFQGSHRRTGCQFSFTCDGSMDARLNQRKWKESVDLAGAVLAGMRLPVSRQATHYHADYVAPRWGKKLTPTATIGTHLFYRFPSRHLRAAAPAAL